VELTVEPRIMIFLPLMVDDGSVPAAAPSGLGVRVGVQLHLPGEGLRLGRPFSHAE